MTWNLADAKNRLTEVVNLALSEGPQTITRRKDAVVVISAAEYEELTGKRQSFKDFLMSGPSFEGLDLDAGPEPDAGCRAVKALLDTCTLAEVRKPDGNPAVKAAVRRGSRRGPLPERPLGGRNRQRHHPPRPGQEEDGPLVLARRAGESVRRTHPRRSTSRPRRIWGELTARAQKKGVIIPADRRPPRRDGPASRAARHDPEHEALRGERGPRRRPVADHVMTLLERG